MLLSANGKDLFESSFFADVVTVYAVVKNDGSLEEVSTSPFPTGGSAFAGAMATDAAGKFLYVGLSSAPQFAELGIQRDGSLTPITVMTVNVSGISLSLAAATFPTEPCH